MVQSLMRTFGEDLKALRALEASEAEFFAVTMALEPVYVYNLMDLAEIKDFAQVIRAAKSLMRAEDEYYDKFGNRQTVVVGGTGEDRDEWNWVQSDVEMLDMLLRERMRPRRWSTGCTVFGAGRGAGAHSRRLPEKLPTS